jgi:hypothetical protein
MPVPPAISIDMSRHCWGNDALAAADEMHDVKTAHEALGNHKLVEWFNHSGVQTSWNGKGDLQPPPAH